MEDPGVTERPGPTDEWFTRDLPVLTEIAVLIQAKKPASSERVAEGLGMGRDDVISAMHALEDAKFYEGFSMHSGSRRAMKLTEKGRRATGVWPSDDAVQALTQALAAAEAAETDPAEKQKIQSVGQTLRTLGGRAASDLAVAIAKAYAAKLGWFP